VSDKNRDENLNSNGNTNEKHLERGYTLNENYSRGRLTPRKI